jgi:RNA polymerase sigma factor (sigma-70 family)
MNDTTSEAQLLQASRAGSKDAFGAIVRRYQALVCALTYSATGDVGTSQELAQETFLRAWRNLRQLEDPGKFPAWLCTIARNLAHTSLRASRRGAAQPLERVAELSAGGPGPDEAALAKERQEIVWAAVRRVPLKYREPLVLFYRRQRSVAVRRRSRPVGTDHRQRLHRRQLIKSLSSRKIRSSAQDRAVRSPSRSLRLCLPPAPPRRGCAAHKAGQRCGRRSLYAILGAILDCSVVSSRVVQLQETDSRAEAPVQIRLFIPGGAVLLGQRRAFYAGLFPRGRCVCSLYVILCWLCCSGPRSVNGGYRRKSPRPASTANRSMGASEAASSVRPDACYIRWGWRMIGYPSA